MPGFLESLGFGRQQQQQQQPQPSGQQAAPNGQQQQQPTGQGQPNGQQQAPGQGQQSTGQPTPNNQVNGSNTPVDPLAAYQAMWQNNTNQEEAPPSLTLDNKVLDQVTGSMDFTKAIKPEVLQRAMSGDSQAMVEMMNEIGRQAYRSALQHNSTLTDKFVSMREDHQFNKRVPSMVRDELTLGALTGADGQKMSPVARQQLAEIAKRYQRANPDASPSEVAAAAKKYVEDIYQAINPNASSQQQQNQQQQPAEVDWDKYFESN